MTDKDRIKLAEAMGWEQHPDGWWSTPRVRGCATHGLDNPPNPFTDANDDYAVLEWVRRDEFDPTQKNDLYDEHCKFVENDGRTNYAVDYQIGDYARAALKVIDV